MGLSYASLVSGQHESRVEFGETGVGDAMGAILEPKQSSKPREVNK